MKKNLLSVLLSTAMVATLLVGCGAKEAAPVADTAETVEEQVEEVVEEKEDTPEEVTETADVAAEGQVYYLNFKPEQDEQWQALAKSYSEQTGVPVTVVTAASGTYEETLTAEIAKDEAPTLFQVNGPVGLANWSDYCYDLSGSDIYNNLTSDAFALKADGEVKGIAYVIESYGIITNAELLEQAGYTTDDIS